MGIFASLFPQTYFLFLDSSQVHLYRSSTAFWDKNKWQEIKKYSISADVSLESVLQDIRKEHRSKADDSWYLGLPLQFFTIISFSLPLEAEENFDQAAKYALMRHVPYDLESAYTHCYRLKNPSEINVWATVIPKNSISEYLNSISAGGISISGIVPNTALWAWQNRKNGLYVSESADHAEMLAWNNSSIVFQAEESGQVSWSSLLEKNSSLIENTHGIPKRIYRCMTPDSEDPQDSGNDHNCLDAEMQPWAANNFENFPYQVNLVPLSVLKNRKKAFWVQLSFIAILLISMLTYPAAHILGQKKSLEHLIEKSNSLKKEANRISALRNENKKIEEYLQALSQEVHGKHVVPEIIKEITEIMPQDVWIDYFGFSKNKIELRGWADSATSVLESLENSPMFKEIKFDSPVVKKQDKEVFKIVSLIE